LNRTTIKAGLGRLYGVINPEDQPGKILKMWDGDILLAHLELDKAFNLTDRFEIDEDTGEEIFKPGLHLAFTRDLQIETDGKDLDLSWQ